MIYVSTACMKKKTIREIIDHYVQNGIYNIELSGGTEYYEFLERDLLLLKKLHNLTYVCHAYFPPPSEHFVVNLASCNDIIYEKSISFYKNCIDLLDRINCNVLSIHAGFLVEIGVNEIGKKLNNMTIYPEKEAYYRFCKAYEYLKLLCEKKSITMYLENNVLSADNYKEFQEHNYLMMTDFESIMKMKEQLDFNLLLDLGHLNVSSCTLGLDYAKQCIQLKDYIEWVHISDNNGIADQHKPLHKKSEILKMYNVLFLKEKNITLETNGNIEEIIRSIILLRN